MRSAARAALLAISVSALLAPVALAGPGAIPLNNGQEVTDAKYGASGSFEYWVDGSQLCYVLSVRRMTSTPFGAHIHGPAGRGDAAGVVIPLDPPDAPTATTDTCTTPSASALAAVLANPDWYYVNVHTAAFPGGEVRGQLK